MVNLLLHKANCEVVNGYAFHSFSVVQILEWLTVTVTIDQIQCTSLSVRFF